MVESPHVKCCQAIFIWHCGTWHTLKKTALEAVEVSGQCQWVLCDHWWVHHHKACRVGKATWGYWGGCYLSLSGWWPRWWTLPWLVAVGIQINSPQNPNSPKKETHTKYIYVYIYKYITNIQPTFVFVYIYTYIYIYHISYICIYTNIQPTFVFVNIPIYIYLSYIICIYIYGTGPNFHPLCPVLSWLT